MTNRRLKIKNSQSQVCVCTASTNLQKWFWKHRITFNILEEWIKNPLKII